MNPPALATWLMTRFGVNEPVIGDLVERYERRPSFFWFWRQTLGTIAACGFRDVRRHKLLTFRAVLLGTLAVWAFSWLIGPPSLWITRGFRTWTIEQNDALRVFVFETNAWLLRLPSLLPWALAGWTIARLHRHNGLTMVVALISGWFLFLVVVVLRGFLVSPTGSLTSATANAFMATVIPRFFSFAAFTFVGGLVGARPTRGHPHPHVSLTRDL
jgi:hypothetical protein